MTNPPSPRRFHTRFLAGLAIAITTSMAVAGCGSNATTGTEQPADAEGGVYRMPIPEPEGGIEPLTASSYGALLVAGLASDGLVSIDKDGELVPHLAESWTESGDGLSWTVQLRDSLEFNDGSDLTAEDVASTFEELIAEDSTSPGKTAFDGVLDAVEAEDEDTVVFNLQDRFVDFPRLLTGTNTVILPKDYEPGDWLENPIGAGQFMLEDYTQGRSATYKKNPRYWDADNVELAGVEIKFYADSQAISLAYQTGEVDQIESTPEVKKTIDMDSSRVQDLGYSQFNGLFLNTDLKPFDDPDVREAIAWALDRERLIDVAHAGDAEVLNDGIFLPDYPIQAEGLEQRKQDAGKAEKLLAGRTVSFTITTPLGPLGQVMQQQLNAVDGFDVDLEVMTTGEYYAEGEDTPWLNAPATLTTWAAGRLPTQFLTLLLGKDSESNASHYSNPELEELGDAYDSTSDEGQRQKIANEISQIIYDDVPMIIPAMMLYRTYLGPRVEGDFRGALDYYGGFDFRGISITG